MPGRDHAAGRRRLLEAHARSARPRALSFGYRLALSGLAVAVAASLLLALQWRTPTTFQVAGHSGQVGAWLSAEPARALALDFSEGSRVSLSAGSRGRVSQVSASGAR